MKYYQRVQTFTMKFTDYPMDQNRAIVLWPSLAVVLMHVFISNILYSFYTAFQCYMYGILYCIHVPSQSMHSHNFQNDCGLKKLIHVKSVNILAGEPHSGSSTQVKQLITTFNCSPLLESTGIYICHMCTFLYTETNSRNF